jgi:geranylgeranyl diphosphate synthase type II
MIKGVIMEFKTLLKDKQENVESLLIKYLPKTDTDINQIVIDAMEYSLLAGGKRIRPIFMQEAFNMCNGKGTSIEAFMVAMEMIHTYSLIHDDLPAMDNDDLRRGIPTCHKKYGEDIAILAGDGLLNRAFEIMFDEAVASEGSINLLKAAKEIGGASSVNGMIGGQVADIIYESKPIDIDVLNYIHKNKTSAIIEASLVAGAILGNAPEDIVEEFRKIGSCIGLAFQIQDDILDIIGDEKKLGKPINSDMKNHKTTYVDLKGIDASKEIVETLLNEAINRSNNIRESSNLFLVDIIKYLKNRSY